MHEQILLCISQHTKFEVLSFINFKYTIGSKIIKTGHMILTTPLRVVSDIFHLHTKFGDSCFSLFGDMTAGVEIENGSHNPDNALLGLVCHPKARI